MKKKYLIITIIALIVISFSSPLNTNKNVARGETGGCVGAGPGTDDDGDGDLCDPGETMFNCTPDCLPAGIPVKSVEDVLDDTIKWVLGFGLMIAVTFLIWGGINYVASSGDAQKAENAKKIIKYSLLGVFVIGFSFAIIVLLDMIFS
ncbi:MAG: pilin [Patescibacteria group bacterium]|nr:pilin [Patescibacteria group bacterium]